MLGMSSTPSRDSMLPFVKNYNIICKGYMSEAVFCTWNGFVIWIMKVYLSRLVTNSITMVKSIGERGSPGELFFYPQNSY